MANIKLTVAKNIPFINKGKGYSAKELKQFIKQSDDSESGMDDQFGDLAIAGRVIEDLLKQLKAMSFKAVNNVESD